MKPLRFIPLCAALAAVLPLAGCGYSTKSDVNSLQASLDSLTMEVYKLEQRVEALESAAAAATPTPQQVVRPTSTPEPASSPRVFNMTADSICSALLKNGMPVVSFKRYTAADDPNGLIGTNAGYTSRADFKDKNVVDAMGIIEVYASASDAQLRLSALEFARAQGTEPDTPEQTFLYDNVLMRLPEPFTEEQGVQYEDALRKVLGLIS